MLQVIPTTMQKMKGYLQRFLLPHVMILWYFVSVNVLATGHI